MGAAGKFRDHTAPMAMHVLTSNNVRSQLPIHENGSCSIIAGAFNTEYDDRFWHWAWDYFWGLGPIPCNEEGESTGNLSVRGIYRWTGKVLRWFGILLLAVAILGVSCALILLWPPVQNRVVDLLGAQASEKLGTEVRVGHVMISPWGQLIMDEVFIADLEGDTLISVGSLRLKSLRVHPRSRILKVGGVVLGDARFAMSTPIGGTKSNLTLLLDKLSGADSTASSDSWTVICKRFNIQELHFSFHDRNVDRIPFGVDFSHVDVTHANIVGRDFLLLGDSIHAVLREFRLEEHSGLRVDELSGATAVTSRGIVVEGMQLRTPTSHAMGRFAMSTERWTDYNNFNELVVMDLDLDTSRIDFSDIAYFVPELEGVDYPIRLSGRMRGTVAELKGRGLSVSFGDRSWFTGTAEFSGLPDIANTFMVLNVDEMRTDHRDIARIPVPPFTSHATMIVPPELERVGMVSFSGNFTGFTRAFTAFGTAHTQIGSIKTDLSYELDTLTNSFSISGRVNTPGFDLGALLGARTLGPVAANVRLSANGRSLTTMIADLEGTLPMVTVNGTRVTGITTKGRLEKNLFNGELSTADPNLVMHFKGLADLRGRWPLVDFEAEVQHMDLRALGFVDTPGYNSLKLDVAADGRLSPDSLLGALHLEDISYCVGSVDHELGDILLRSGRQAGMNNLELDATFAKARVEGMFLPTLLWDLAENTVYSVFPALRNDVVYDHPEQWFDFEVVTGESDAVLDLFVPGLAIAPGSTVRGALDSRSFDIDLTASIPHLVYGTTVLDTVEVVLDKTMDVLVFSVRSDKQTFKDSTWFIGSSATGIAYQDEVEVTLAWDGSNNGTNGQLDLAGQVRSMHAMDLDLLPSTLYFGRGNWVNQDVAHFAIDSSTVRVDSLVLWNGEQRMAFHGGISRDPEVAMFFEMEDVRLENLSPVYDGPRLSGSVGGDGEVYDLYGTPYLSSYLCVDSVHVVEKLVGDVKFTAAWSKAQGYVDLSGAITRGPVKALDFKGRMEPANDNKLDVDLLLDRFDLTFIEPYLPEGISRIQGLVTGTIDVSGNLVHPEVNGEVDMVDAGLRIDYLNTLYRFTHKVKIAPDMFALDLVTLFDEEGHSARIGGTILHNGLKNWNFNVWGEMNDLMVLNTTERDNSLYYGKAYANGELEVSGSVDLLEITVDARTSPGTDIHFPVGGSTEVSDIGFVRFTSGDTSALSEQVVDLSGIALDLNVEVTPDALFEIIFDPTVGDIMSGRGRGDIEMTVNNAGEFRMLGQVELTDGDYLFTLRNVVNKRFVVAPGGRIIWYGDPFDAQLDLQALYKVRAPLYDIMFEKNEAYKKRVPVDVVMRLRDKLLNPEIGFEVRLPTVDENVRTQVNSVLSTEQELNRQVFALIVLNRFVQPPSYSGAGTPGTGGNIAETTTSELLSNQVSNWLSKMSDDFDLGVNYRPGDRITQDELEVAMSTQLFNERLLLSTNLGVAYGAQNSSTGNTLIGDFQVEYLLTPEGRLRLKAFSVSNDQNLTRTDQVNTTQGAGVAYREEFRTFSELWQRLMNNFRPSEKDRKFD